MNKDSFWKIIAEARAAYDDDNEVAASVVNQLRSMTPDDLFAFHKHIEECLAESYRYDLWAVAYIVNGGCSDDGFEYFRGWLIVQGREYYEAALTQPERAADRADPGNDNYECEDILYAAPNLYERSTGQPMPKVDVQSPPSPLGEPWEEDKLESLHPDLCERFFA